MNGTITPPNTAPRRGPVSVHLFPGQGDFALSPFTRTCRSSGALWHSAQAVFEEVDHITAEHSLPSLASWLLGPHPPSGRALAAAPWGTAQLALYGASLAVHRALCAARGTPGALVGVSFGEIAALTAAGVYTVADGARIAYELAQVLASCPGGLTLLACSERTVAAMLARADVGDVVVAVVSDQQETIVSGPLAELDALEKHAGTHGVTSVRLRLPFSSHHPGLEPQAEKFAQAVRALPASSAHGIVYSAVAGRAYTAHEDFPRRLADCLVRPARLPDLIRLVTADQQPGLFLEAGTGSALSRSVQRTLADGTRIDVRAPLADAAFPW